MSAVETKSCSKCKEVKPLEDFALRNDGPKGRQSHCKICRRAWGKAFRAENPGYKRPYYEATRVRQLVQQKKRYEANREKALAWHKRWKKEHPELYNYYNAKRNAAKLSATLPGFEKEIKEIYKNCPRGFHVDHIVPLQGENVCGLHVPWNLQYLPAIENIKKGNRYVNNGHCEQNPVEASKQVSRTL